MSVVKIVTSVNRAAITVLAHMPVAATLVIGFIKMESLAMVFNTISFTVPMQYHVLPLVHGSEVYVLCSVGIACIHCIIWSPF